MRSADGACPIAHDHPNFWFDLAGKIGPAVFAATLVGCLLSEHMSMAHYILLGVGLALILVGHRGTYHRG